MISPSSSTARGVAYGMGAGALWGLVFLAPRLLAQFNGVEMAAGRYLAYGLISLILILPRWRQLRGHLTRRDWLGLAWLALLANTLYYVLLSTAVQTGGIAMTSLIIGFLPVVVTIIGSRDHGAVPLLKLLPSLALCAAGVACIGGQAFARATTTTPTTQVIGVLCAIGALASWTTYAVGNSRYLARLDGISAGDWNLLTGIVTGAQALVLVPVGLVFPSGHHTAGDWMWLAGVSVAIAVLASVVGNALWNRMSRLLPLTLVGQIILFETLFALVYGFAWERRWPTVLEAVAFVFVALGVMSCIATHRRPPGKPHNL